ncbi:MAG TPA: hypothetical protein VFH72_13900 [Candidatus Baltobacteraceae bacterium]|nr:hypothetical protein [Candidatus Baltobacteraceae bacterium]
MSPADKQAIDEITASFFGAFTNLDGAAADVDRLYRLFLPQARIVMNVGGAARVYDVAGFVEPRRALLSGGVVRDFVEEETYESTDIFGAIAQRFSRYRKRWTESGVPKNGGGAKSLQFVRTADGWRIASLIWDDD